MGEAPVSLIVGRYFAIIGLVLALIVPIPFAHERTLTVVHDGTHVSGGSVSVTLEQKTLGYNATRRHAPRQLVWPIVAMLAFAAAFGEGYAYRRAVSQQRKASFGGSVARAVPVVGAGAFAIVGCWYAWGSKELEPSFGLLVAVAATAVVVVTFLRELAACKAGERGWIDYPPPTTLPFADVRR
jgi:hypothetical protein